MSPAAGASLLAVAGLHCAIGGRAVLRGLELTLAPGERVALLGTNGAGKSTLFRVLAGRLPYRGAVSLDGHRPGTRAARALLGVIPQRLALFRRLTVRENLEAFARLQGVAPREARRAAERSLAWVALADRARSPVATLSGGMQRRLSIACGAIHRPALLLADEPLVGVDVARRQPVERLLDELRARGTAILESTHELDVVDARYDRVVLLSAGLVARDGPPDAVLAAVRGLPHRCRMTTARPLEPAACPPGFRVEGCTVAGEATDVAAALEAVLAALRRADIALLDLQVERPALHALVEEAGREAAG